MGSKRDGVRVEYAKHHIRTGKAVRARVRAGTHPCQMEVPRHHKRRGGRKRFGLFALYGGGMRFAVGRYATLKAAESAKLRHQQGTGLASYYAAKHGPAKGYEVVDRMARGLQGGGH